MRKTPEFEECFAELIRLPSVSSIDPEHNQSNRGVIDALANWLEALGFACEIMPVSDKPEKCNLIASRGEGEGGLVLSIPDAIGRVLEKRYVSDGSYMKSKYENSLLGEICPECGQTISFEEGCIICHFCGFTKCG